MNIIRTLYTSPALWACALLIALTLGMPLLQPMFAQIFPELERPIYTQDSFLQLLLAHVFIVDLPEPEVPMMTVILPRSMCKDKSSMTDRPSKILVTCSK
jgi:osmoprotectant transport system permease protein